MELIEQYLERTKVDIELTIPYNNTGIISQIYDSGDVIGTDYREDAIHITLSISPDEVGRFRRYMTGVEED